MTPIPNSEEEAQKILDGAAPDSPNIDKMGIAAPARDLERTIEAEHRREFNWGVKVGADLERKLSHTLALVSLTDCKVVICGESGVGKEVVAHAIHRNSNRREKPFAAFNCAAVPEELIESELFGYERGSFTGAYRPRRGKFEAADGGTLFLDEIADMSLFTQAKVLRAMETGEIARVGSQGDHRVNIRVIVATNKNLPRLVREGKFREDLFWRLGKVEIRIPPLRERRSDILFLANHFLESLASKSEARKISREAEGVLREYLWPGNVRELQAVIEAAAITARGPELTAEDVERYFRYGLFETTDHNEAGFSGKLRETEAGPDALDIRIDTTRSVWEIREDVTREYYRELLKKFQWRIGVVAEKAGVCRRTCQKELRCLGLYGDFRRLRRR